MIKEKIANILQGIVKELSPSDSVIDLEHPINSAFGDYSTSIALKLTKQLKKTPIEVAQMIVNEFPKNPFIEKVEVIKPGFINFWLADEYLLKNVQTINSGNFKFPSFHFGKEKKVMVEYAHPNTLKLFHIGHLRNIITGESIVRILEVVGNKLIRSNYQGDVGLHIAKCLYTLRSKKLDVGSLKTTQEKIRFLGKAYSEGQRAYENDEQAKKEIHEINKMVYEQNREIFPLWQETRQWSLDYFKEIYKRVYSHFDCLYFESEMAKKGIEIVNHALKKGILEKSEGAIVFVGKKYGLDIRVFINSLGFPTYEGKELALAEKEFSDFGEIDKCIHLTTPEQSSFFKVTFKVEELLDRRKKDKQYHLMYEWVNLKGGKMSSREGNVIEADWLIDEAKKKIIGLFKCSDDIAETLAIAAVKYSFLKNGVLNQIAFDFDESISIEGNSGPYLLYTYVRAQSILRKGNVENNVIMKAMNKDEKKILQLIYRFSSVVEKSAINFSPNYIATYLFELAQQFNLFYQKHPVLKADEETKNFRLFLTKAVGNVLKKGLDLLGIKTVEKM